MTKLKHSITVFACATAMLMGGAPVAVGATAVDQPIASVPEAWSPEGRAPYHADVAEAWSPEGQEPLLDVSSS